ncbi:HlyD family efflux transporter periplasmic adaptor subunit [Flavobacteriaceae bacterium]|nr:HlyD family efflux transporter periplasmic adaptor subunit [Flavobacteriaceae bacterium]MDA9015927.1 HlyD family efflux transporter periplasmic adaptor subunit [Flavobacteriaceae bacterium]MDB3862490.1 HlyD family efflux transporter periplasmic adaptor subunit [Flavobacteriaceae bacterium]MDC3354202.1 HlyD family efflux transporter periplasmic adaptor subunit [Flavobacteriaceae bacterium]
MSQNRLKNIRKIILSILGLLIIFGSYLLSKSIANSNPPPRRQADKLVKEVYYLEVKNSTYKVQIPSNGILEAYQRIKITSRVQGLMQTISPLFKSGQAYKKGQVLAQIESSEFRLNVIAQRASLYNLITSVLPDLELDFSTAYLDWRTYLTNFDVQKEVPPLPAMEDDVRLFISGRGIISSYYTLQNLEKSLSFYTIIAPFNGVLVATNVTEGSLVRPGQELGDFIAPDDYELKVALPKSYVEKIAVGAMVDLKSIDTQKQYKGRVARINAKVNSETQSVEVFIRVNDSELREGVYMEALIGALEFENVFAVDRGLLNGDQELYLVEENKLILKKVDVVHFTESKAIIQGVADGLKIVAQPIIGAYQGMEVTPNLYDLTK